MAEDRRARIERFYRRFAELARTESPLYSVLADHIAGDADLIELTTLADERQPPANMLFAAVHYLLLRGADHPLRAHYATVAGDEPRGGDPIALFVDFVIAHRDDIEPLLATRRVQTNEVRRAGLLLPGFAWVHGRTGLPLATVEVGTAAGLLTLWDRYAYQLGTLPLGSGPLRIETEVRGSMAEISMPAKAWAVGIDVNPIDVSDPDQADWLRALVWPDQVERMSRLTAAIEIARMHLPTLMTGDGIDMVEEIGRDAPDDAALVVHHSFALNQVSPQRRSEFESALLRLGGLRPTFLVAIEWEGGQAPDDMFRLRVADMSADGRRLELAKVHHHGAWLEWVA